MIARYPHPIFIPKRTTAWVLVLSSAIAVGCPTPSDDTGVYETGETASPLTACEPALSLSANPPMGIPHQLLDMRGEGGTGSYVFRIANPDSDAEVHPDNGSLLLGSIAETTERIELTDTGCIGSASADIEVLSPMVVVPSTLHIPPGLSTTFVTSGGSGEFTCETVQDHSGGSLSGCDYQSGPTPGNDRIEVHDSQTGQVVSATIQVDLDVTYRARGQQWIVPLGASLIPEMMGGSGLYTAEVISGELEVIDNTLISDSPGTATVRLSDPHVAMETTILVSTVEPLGTTTGVRGGFQTMDGLVIGPGDLNGDGYEDAVLGWRELQIHTYLGGGVAVFAGGPTGLEPEPSQVLGGDGMQEYFGHAVLIEDLDDDGEKDLIVGAYNATEVTNYGGAIRIYRGVSDGFFEEEAASILQGENNYDRLGVSLSLCDFNQDGWLDLAAGAYQSDDNSALELVTNHGGVHIYLGNGSLTFDDKPDISIWGQMWDGEAFSYVEDLEMGRNMTTGDLNGDGLCDVVASNYNYAIDGDGSDGILWAFLGTDEGGLVIDTEPSHIIAMSAEDSAHFGRHLTLVDLDEDGADELIVGSPYAEEDDQRGGGVFLYSLQDPSHFTPQSLSDPFDADWRVMANNSSDLLGTLVTAADFDDDGDLDLMIGAANDEVDGGTGGVGLVRFYDGDSIVSDIASGAPYNATDHTPDQLFVGVEQSARFGQAGAPIGDADGDGILDYMILAGHDSAYGIKLGAPYFVSGADPTPQILTIPGSESGARVGTALALLDLNDDTHEDLVIGAPGVAVLDIGREAGFATFHLGDGVSFATEPFDQRVIDTPADGHRVGWLASPVGDVNSDGFSDLAIVARRSKVDYLESVTDLSSCDYQGRGAALIYTGGSAGLSTTPAFRLHSPTDENYLERVEGPVDHNGDGYNDVLIGSRIWNDYAGGFLIGYGEPDVPGELVTLCNVDVYHGDQEGAELGYEIASLGDLDGDGCDEIGATAKDQDLGVTSQGILWVLWGWGGASCPSEPQVTAIGPGEEYADLGTGLAGGRDIDGDGVPDLVVSASNRSIESSAIGTVWLLSGVYLQGLPRQSLIDGALPGNRDAIVLPPTPIDGITYALLGQESGAKFGDELAIITDPRDSTRSLIAVGIPYGSSGESIRAGTVEVYQWLPGQGFDPVPVAVMVSEPGTNQGILGAALARGHLSPTLAVGAPFSYQHGIAQGAVYAVTLELTGE